MASSLFLVNLETVTSFAATYWLHSTLLLGAAWLLLCSAKPDSHFVRERIWKLAATAGFATAAVQLATGLGISLVTEPDSTPSEQASRLVTRSVSEGLSRETSPSNLTPAEASRHLKTSLQIVQESLNELGEGLPATLAESKSQDEPAPRKSTVAPKIDPALLTSVTYLPLEEGVTLNPIPVETTESADVLEETVVPSTVPDAESTSADNRWFPGAVSAVVLAWFSLSLLYLAWQSLRFRWQMRHVSPAAPSHRKLLDSICGSRGVKRRVRLLNSDRFEEPVAYGLFRPTILIPAQVEKQLNRDELAALLSHELAHLTRGDILWLVIGRVLATSFAFQPLNFLARRRWQEHAEFQCDDWAVDRNVDRLTLARSLTLVAEWRAGQKSCAGVVSAGGARFHISDRVERLVADAVPDLWRRGSRRFAIHLAALMVAGAVVAFGPQTGSAERPNVADENEAEAASARSRNDEETAKEAEELPTDQETAPAISKELLSELIREVDGLTGDVSGLLAELRTLEPLLARLEKQPELTDKVAQLRTRIGLLRKLSDMRAQRRTVTEETALDDSNRRNEGNKVTRSLR